MINLLLNKSLLRLKLPFLLCLQLKQSSNIFNFLHFRVFEAFKVFQLQIFHYTFITHYEQRLMSLYIIRFCFKMLLVEFFMSKLRRFYISAAGLKIVGDSDLETVGTRSSQTLDEFHGRF